MKIGMHVVWYERNKDFSPDYTKEHHGNIYGVDPQDCMHQLRVLVGDHDLNKYTRIEIQYIF